MLIDLYLRKTRFTKIKISTRKTDTMETKQKTQTVNKSNADISELVYASAFISTK